jgi:hypothetical protein
MGVVGVAGRKLGVLPFSARGEAQAAHKLAQNFCRLVMAALHEKDQLLQPRACFAILQVYFKALKLSCGGVLREV